MISQYKRGAMEGFDIYTSSDTNKIDETLADAERRVGLAKS